VTAMFVAIAATQLEFFPNRQRSSTPRKGWGSAKARQNDRAFMVKWIFVPNKASTSGTFVVESPEPDGTRVVKAGENLVVLYSKEACRALIVNLLRNSARVNGLIRDGQVTAIIDEQVLRSVPTMAFSSRDFSSDGGLPVSESSLDRVWNSLQRDELDPFSRSWQEFLDERMASSEADVCKLCSGQKSRPCHRCGGREILPPCQVCSGSGTVPCPWCSL